MYDVGIDDASRGRSKTGYLYADGTRISEDGPIWIDWKLIFTDGKSYDIACTQFDEKQIRTRTYELVIENAIGRGLANRGYIHMPVD